MENDVDLFINECASRMARFAKEDFLVGCNVNNELTKKVLIECDSQKYHERNEKERRYEKARDRYIKIKGFDILHYTGKEIMENPFKVAIEIIEYTTGTSDLYDNSPYFGEVEK